MGTGSVVGSIDVAQITLYVFWVFFAALIWYIRKEDRREGYPLENDVTGEHTESWLFVPPPKTFTLSHGRGTVSAPNGKRDSDTREFALKRTAQFPGAPRRPTGNPLKDGVGPASWAERDDEPDITMEGENRIVPLRVATDFHVVERDPDPRGMQVIGIDRQVAGTVSDVWVDRSEQLIRYFEVDTGGGAVLLPINFVKFMSVRGGGRAIKIRALTGAQIADAPRTASPDAVTRLEEDKITGYFGGGKLYALDHRQEPFL